MFMITVWFKIFFLLFAEAASGMPSTLSYFQSTTKSSTTLKLLTLGVPSPPKDIFSDPYLTGLFF